MYVQLPSESQSQMDWVYDEPLPWMTEMLNQITEMLTICMTVWFTPCKVKQLNVKNPTQALDIQQNNCLRNNKTHGLR